ncbi:uncharacterized protein LOC135165400 [Diachasmimorpha longicaudata]|uniref:uncharacterized protein LOC135165400 n=1 Tax=Diachasmimorpha longicaudata TaxID=58733 RepID=UPI0030B8BDC1
MSKEIRSMIDQRILEKASWNSGFISPMFLIPKADGKFRQIFNLRCLNEYLDPPKFRLVSHRMVPPFLQTGDYLVKIDLSQAYLHVPIKQSHRRFLCLSFKDQLYNITCLPFGLSTAPVAFSRISNWLANTLRQRGMRVLVYLDDFLLASQSAQELKLQVLEILDFLRSLGWIVNAKKSTVTPNHRIEFLGIIWDTRLNEMVLPTDKKAKILTLLGKMLKSGTWSWRSAASLLGMLNFASTVNPLGRLFCRQLQRGMHRLSKSSPKTRFPLLSLSRADCPWWKSNIHRTSSIFQPEPEIFLSPDASQTGWGFDLDKTHWAGLWTPEEMTWHINRKELFTVLKAIQMFEDSLRDRSIMLQSDNKTVVAYIRNQGGTRSLVLLNLVKELLLFLDQHNIRLVPFFLPGRYNTIADRLSRSLTLPDWHLSDEILEGIFQKWGKPEVDLFASAQSKIVPRYVSIDAMDREALFTNAFSRPWNVSLAWVFPPPPLIPKVLHHLNTATGIFLLVVPRWEATFWRGDLKSRALDAPLKLMNLENHLVDLSTGVPPQELKELFLEVWKSKDIPSHNPTAQHLVQYLSNLFYEKQLAFRSILTQKSVICSLSGVEKNTSLSANPLIKSLLKAMGMQRARQEKPQKKITWDVDILTSWMSAHPPSEDSMFQVSRFVATQLLLASGRRVHNLTLLSIDPSFCDIRENTIVFSPEFGSKTDSVSSRQPGWQISSSQDREWNPVHWTKELIRLSAERRKARKSLTALFITTRGEVKAASRAVIAGWIKTAFKEAEIQASAGSARAAVASRNFQDNMGLDELLARGNWRGEGNFLRHYCKRIDRTKRPDRSISLVKSFKPVLPRLDPSEGLPSFGVFTEEPRDNREAPRTARRSPLYTLKMALTVRFR